MTTKFKILSTISFITLAIVLTFVGVWALTDLDFIVGGNITYTAPEPEVVDESQHPMLSFKITDSTNKYVSVEAGSTAPTGDITIPQSVLISGVEYTVTSITSGDSGIQGEGGFGGYKGIISIKIPNTVTKIGDSAFFSCSSLTSIVIPDKVTSIGVYTFRKCTSLTSVVIGNSVTSIGDYAFYNCTGLTSITIPDSVTSIGPFAFEACTGLESVTIGNGVTSIGLYAFYGCTGLTSVSVGSGNSVYDSRNNCNAIIETSTNTLILGCKNTVIPSTVTSIGNSAFYGCTGLTSITIPDSVTSIVNAAFARCTSLTSITIPDSVTSIDNNAFRDSTSLEKIEVKATTPPTGGSDMFSNCPLTIGILVPSASVDSYKSATYWKDYNIVDGGF